MADSLKSHLASGTVYRSLSAVRHRFPGTRTNPSLHLATMIRWCTRGIRQPDGSRVRLRAIRVGSRWLTSDAWVDEFIAVLTTAHCPNQEVLALRSPAQRNKASDAAAKELAEKYKL